MEKNQKINHWIENKYEIHQHEHKCTRTTKTPSNSVVLEVQRHIYVDKQRYKEEPFCYSKTLNQSQT